MSALDRLNFQMEHLDSLAIPAGDLIVYRDHQVIYRKYAGFSDDAKTRPLQGNELYYYFSATKIFTCCAALQLIEQGRLALTDRVDRYLPAYGKLTVQVGDHTVPAATPLTIRHLMGMQSGMSYDLTAPALRDAMQKYGAQATTRQLVDALAAVPLGFEPGSDYRYSLSHDVLATVIEVVSGMTFGEYLKKNIMEPCGIHDISFSVSQDRKDRICAMYMHSEADGKPVSTLTDIGNNYALSDRYESGGAGLNGNVADYILLLDALACDGLAATGNRILKPETVRLWSSVKAEGKPRETFDKDRGRLGYTYGLGVRIMEHCHHAKALSPDGEFGWDGAAGAYALVDPVHHLSIFFAMHVRNYGDVYFQLHPLLRDLVYEALLPQEWPSFLPIKSDLSE